MSLKSINRVTSKIGVKIAAWYSCLLLCGMIVFFLMTYYFLSATLKSRDNQEILSEMNELSNEFKTSDVDGLRIFIDSHLSSRLKQILFIRISDSDNRTLYLHSPFENGMYKIELLEELIQGDSSWITLENTMARDTLSILTKQLPTGVALQVGMSSENKHRILKQFSRLFFIGIVPLIIAGIVGGVFLSFRILKPLRNIITTVESIDTGKMDSRVPRSGTGDELDELARLFNNMLDKINNLIAGMKESLDNVAHDLRTPLTRLRNISEEALINLGEDDPGRDAHATTIEESERIMKMLITLMDISEAETGVMTLNKSEVLLKDLVLNICDMYQMIADNKSIAISVDVPDELTVLADPDRLAQVMANLVDNAVKFVPEKGNISLEARAKEGRVIISVRDSGPGIPDYDIDKIWDRLFRGDQSRSEKGIGLGLSLVKAIVYAHNGVISVTRTHDDETVFSIDLPM